MTVVYKFGGSSVADAARMREVAEIICSFPEHLPLRSDVGDGQDHQLAA